MKLRKCGARLRDHSDFRLARRLDDVLAPLREAQRELEEQQCPDLYEVLHPEQFPQKFGEVLPLMQHLLPNEFMGHRTGEAGSPSARPAGFTLQAPRADMVANDPMAQRRGQRTDLGGDQPGVDMSPIEPTAQRRDDLPKQMTLEERVVELELWVWRCCGGGATWFNHKAASCQFSVAFW